MRGDSRRDLYAKALALCGLGVLAGAGAVVDYWPVGLRFPAAALAVDGPAVVSVAMIATPTVSEETFARLTARIRYNQSASGVRSHVESLPELLTADEAGTTPSYASLPVERVGFELGSPLPVEALPLPALVSARHELSSLIEPTLLAAPAPMTSRMLADIDTHHERVDGAFAGPVASADTGNGFIRTAVRKTGSSIVRTGVVTGSSLADAARAVGSVFRRALPD